MRWIFLLYAVFAVPTLAAASDEGQKTAATLEFERISSGLKAVGEKGALCHQEAVTPEVVSALSDVLWFEETQVPLSYYTNERKAVDSEVSTLSDFYTKTEGCKARYVEQLNQIHPAFAQVIAKSISQRRDQIVALLKKEISYGEFLTNIARVGEEMHSSWMTADEQVRAKLAEMHQSEVAQIQYQEQQAYERKLEKKRVWRELGKTLLQSSGGQENLNSTEFVGAGVKQENPLSGCRLKKQHRVADRGGYSMCEYVCSGHDYVQSTTDHRCPE